MICLAIDVIDGWFFGIQSQTHSNLVEKNEMDFQYKSNLLIFIYFPFLFGGQKHKGWFLIKFQGSLANA